MHNLTSALLIIIIKCQCGILQGRKYKNHLCREEAESMGECIQLEHGTFIPLVLGSNGGIEAECLMFVKTLAKFVLLKYNV